MSVTLSWITALSLALVPSPPSQEAAQGTFLSEEQLGLLASRGEELLGLSIYVPEFVAPKEMLRVAADLTRTSTSYCYVDEYGFQVGIRERFVLIAGSIGIQDLPEGREAALELLAEIDAIYMEWNSTPWSAPSADAPRVTEVYRPRAVQSEHLWLVLEGRVDGLHVEQVPGMNSLLLTGSAANLESAHQLLQQLDVAPQQFQLECMILVAGDDGQWTAPDVLRKGLEVLLPGQTYAVQARAMVQGAAGSGSSLRLASSIGKPGDTSARDRFELTADPVAYDAESGSLTLDQFEFRHFARVTKEARGGVTTEVHMDPQQILSDLVLVRGEYAVVGSLGAQQELVVLRFEPLD